MSEAVARLMGDHWLKFGGESGHEVMGCQCGFRADLDADCGYGDSVVGHLLGIGIEEGERHEKP